jgi:hypothetical protein
VTGCCLRLIKKAEREPTSISLRTLVRIAYGLGVAPTAILPGLDCAPDKPTRLARQAVSAALRGIQLCTVRSQEP